MDGTDWIPNTLSPAEYTEIKNSNDPALRGFVGFGCSFAGKWWGGYAKSGERNYCLNAKNSLKKKSEKLKGVAFYNEDYENFVIPENSLVYCDIPYKNTTGYSVEFNHDSFYEWVRVASVKNKILISDYEGNQPSDATIVWMWESKQDMRNKENKKERTIEILYEFKSK